MTTAGEEEEIGGATAFGRQGATSAVRRRVALDYTTLASYRPDMYEGPRNSEYSRDVCNLSNTGFYPRSKQKISLSLSLNSGHSRCVWIVEKRRVWEADVED